MYNNFQQALPLESDECLTKGICSVNPTLTSIQEIIMLHIKQLAFYLLKLKDLGGTNTPIKELIVATLFNIVANAEYNQEEFHTLVEKMDQNIAQSKALYEECCQKSNISTESIKTYFRHGKNFDLTDAIIKGEKYFLKKINSFTTQQKALFDIMLFLVKSVAIKMVEAQKLEIDYDDAYYGVLSLLNAMNLTDFSEENAKKEISKFLHTYYKIIKDVFYAQNEIYGNISLANVSLSITPGKAILVSGSDYKKLENVLKATEGTEINIYTHGMEMLMAHAFPKLKAYKNLKGHFGTGLDSAMIDFATFPGAILMTKGTLQKVEYLYRGRLFTLDPIAPMGVIKIKDNDFTPLIKSALDAKGFTKAQAKPPAKVGFSIKEIEEKISTVIDKLVKKKIKHLYILGLLNLYAPNKQYFEKFINLLPKDCYAISLAYKEERENVLYFDSLFDYSLLYIMLRIIKDKISLEQMDISVFLTRCDKHTISNLLYLKEIGIKNVYMCKCSPTLINPMLVETLQDTFGIKEITDAQKDLEETLGK